MTTYLMLVDRVVRSGRSAKYACFGTFSAGAVEGSIVIRNTFLVVGAILVVGQRFLGGGQWSVPTGSYPRLSTPRAPREISQLTKLPTRKYSVTASMPRPDTC